MKVLVAFVFISFGVLAERYIADYPIGPVASLTPGRLCERPDAYRYAERIPYCNRDVNPMLKEMIFREYREIGYRLDPRRREDFKIDHLVPLCAGGSNDEDNLWPQHVSIFSQTDTLESLGCEKLKLGKIRHTQLVQLIVAAKRDLNLLPRTLSYLSSLR
jgi:hypothetical protein